MARPQLKLVVNNQKQKNFIAKFWQWLNAPRCIEFKLPFGLTYLEKKEAIQKYLTLKFAEYQTTTNSIGLFPLCEAINEVERLERNGQIEAYYRKIKKKLAAI